MNPFRRASPVWGATGLATLLSASAIGQSGSPDRLDEVVVTAQKRAENLQEVPISIAAYSADALQTQSIARLSDLGQVAPNFFYGQQVQSGSSAGQLYIRGVGQHDTNSTFNPSVGMYVDGVYIARAAANDIDFAEAQRVEVLYGPQGTLFGKNTNGGAINVVTRQPDFAATRPEMNLEIQAGEFHRFDALGGVSLPLSPGTAGLQLNVARRSQEGYSTRTDGEEQANQNRTSGRAQFWLKPSDTFNAILRLDGTTLNEHSSAYKLVEVRTTSTVPVAYASSTAYRYDNRWVTDSDFTYNGTGPNRNAGTVWGTSLHLNWIQPWGVVESISAYRRIDIESDFDPDGSALAVLDVFNSVQQHQLSQELQATGSSWNSQLQWVFGLYYFSETVQDNQPANVALELLHGAANFDPRLHIVNKDYAGYGQIHFDMTEQLRLTLGARLGKDQAQVQRIQVDYPVPTVEQPLVRRSANWTAFLPKASLEYQWTPDLMTYVSAAEGTKSGGFNGRAGSIAEFNGFAPEKVWTYELGVKSDWLHKRVRFNATAFYSVYTDFQILLNSSVTDPATGNPVAFSFVGNMPKASIRGGELSVTALPAPGLELTGGLGITDGRYDRVLDGAPVTTSSQFVDAPKMTASAGVDYTVPVGTAALLRTHLDYVHKSTIQYDYGNSPLVAQRPYGLLNARVSMQLRDSHLSLFLAGTNLTDVHYAIGGLDDGSGGSLGEVVKLMGPPRELGVGFQYRY